MYWFSFYRSPSAPQREEVLTSIKVPLGGLAMLLEKTVKSEGSMRAARPINSVAEFYAHAIAIERESAQRYAEFARHMKDRGQDTAQLFSRMAREGFAHASEIGTRAKGLRVPKLAPGKYAWLDKGAPEPAAHEWVFRLMSPRCALKIAMHAEQRAKRFFGQVMRTTGDRGVKAVARKFLEEEGEHISRMRRALIKLPNPILDWEKIYECGGPTGDGKGSPGKSPASRAKPVKRGAAARRIAGASKAPAAAGTRAIGAF